VYDVQRVADNHQCDHFGEVDITGRCSGSVAHLTLNGLVVKKILYFELLDGEALKVNGDYFCIYF